MRREKKAANAERGCSALSGVLCPRVHAWAGPRSARRRKNDRSAICLAPVMDIPRNKHSASARFCQGAGNA